MTDEPTAGDPAPVRIRLDIAYDGTNFSGWARQPGLRTVQGTLEAALATLFLGHPPAPTLTVAGRTDAGVHALGQVAHVDLDAAQTRSMLRPRRARNDADDADAAAALLRRLSGILRTADADVVVTAATPAPPGFDARFGAVWRRYEYRVADASAPKNPLTRFTTAWHPSVLDVDAMDAAAHTLVGLHDFATYCKPRVGATTIRSLQEFSWRRDVDGVLAATVRADAFCHSMVRALVGACVAVGEGRLRIADLVLLRETGQRTSAFKVMPARGLTLMRVGYPDHAELASRAELTRARRKL